VVTPYDDGIALMPKMCPFGGDGRACRIGRHMKRERSCGPEIALVVAVCREHGVHFTLYPLGWVPYGREAVMDVSSSRANSSPWSKSMFVACLAAAELQIWPRESLGVPVCGLTQTRWIRRCGQWLGLSGSVSMAETASVELSTSLAEHLEGRQCFCGSRLRCEQGRAVVEVLASVAVDESLLSRLLAVGSMTGACGRAWSCDRTGVLQPLFRN